MITIMHSMGNPKNIILRMPNWIGDAVMGEPIIRDLKAAYPDCQLTLMCQGAIGQLFRYHPFVDEIFTFKKPSGWIGHLRRDPLISDLRKGEYEAGFLLTDSFSSAFWLYRGHVERRIGFGKNGRSFLLTDPIAPPKNPHQMHQIDYYKSLLEGIGIAKSNRMPTLFLTEEERGWAEKFLSYGRGEFTWVGVNPGAHFGSAKCWPKERFRTTIQALLEKKEVAIILFGDGGQKELVDTIAEGLGERVINLAGKTSLRELMATISHLKVLLTNDSGPMHIAGALNVPVVALFGSTSVTKTGPWGKSEVLCEHVACAPCFRRTCPIDFRCMMQIHPDKVLNRVQSFLE